MTFHIVVISLLDRRLSETVLSQLDEVFRREFREKFERNLQCWDTGRLNKVTISYINDRRGNDTMFVKSIGDAILILSDSTTVKCGERLRNSILGVELPDRKENIVLHKSVPVCQKTRGEGCFLHGDKGEGCPQGSPDGGCGLLGPQGTDCRLHLPQGKGCPHGSRGEGCHRGSHDGLCYLHLPQGKGCPSQETRIEEGPQSDCSYSMFDTKGRAKSWNGKSRLLVNTENPPPRRTTPSTMQKISKGFDWIQKSPLLRRNKTRKLLENRDAVNEISSKAVTRINYDSVSTYQPNMVPRSPCLRRNTIASCKGKGVSRIISDESDDSVSMLKPNMVPRSPFLRRNTMSSCKVKDVSKSVDAGSNEKLTNYLVRLHDMTNYLDHQLIRLNAESLRTFTPMQKRRSPTSDLKNSLQQRVFRIREVMTSFNKHSVTSPRNDLTSSRNRSVEAAWDEFSGIEDPGFLKGESLGSQYSPRYRFHAVLQEKRNKEKAARSGDMDMSVVGVRCEGRRTDTRIPDRAGGDKEGEEMMEEEEEEGVVGYDVHGMLAELYQMVRKAEQTADRSRRRHTGVIDKLTALRVKVAANRIFRRRANTSDK